MTSRCTVDTHTARRVPVAPGLVMLSPVTITAEVDGLDARVELEVVALPAQGERAGRLVCSEVRVRQREGGLPITGEALRAVPVAHLTLAHGPEMAMALDPETEVWISKAHLSAKRVADLRAGGPTGELLRVVAYLYRLAVVLGDGPRSVIETTFAVSRSTAGRWIALARQHGHLGAVEGPGKAGG